MTGFLDGLDLAPPPRRRMQPGQRYVLIPETGCWNWLGGLTKAGYGQITVDGRTMYAHRWSYETHVGPIPYALVIDHLCSNKRCVNPAHLEPVTISENARRGQLRRRARERAERAA